MRKFLSVLLVLVLVFAFSGTHTAFAIGQDNDLAYFGIDELGSESTVLATDGVIVTKNGVPKQGITVSDISKVGVALVRVKTTTRNTTILATETGKTFICTANSKFQLPTAADGLKYTFITQGSAEVEIQVATTPNTIKLVGPGDGDGSQGVIETGINTTGNTVTLISDGTSWYASVEPLSAGAWVDGGVWQVFSAGENE